MANLFTPYLVPLFFSFYLSSSLSDKLPSTYATSQMKFWSENVKNEMPISISTKLSPLNKLDSDYYAEAISQNNFNSDTKFCSLAKLACSFQFDQSLKEKGKIYEAKIYAKSIAPNQAKVDPFSFFRSSNLKEGDTIHLSNLEASLPHRAFLPPQIASKLSLTLNGVTKLFPRSPKDAIETTLSYCSSAAGVKRELKFCPKSLEEMIGFSKTALKATKLLSLTSKNTAGSDSLLVIGKVKQFNVEKFVACHEMFLPFATYYCHSVPSSQIYSVDLIEPETRAAVNTAVAVCHLDTSTWPKEHVAFKVLKFGPGQGEACHWMNQIDLAWVADVEN